MWSSIAVFLRSFCTLLTFAAAGVLVSNSAFGQVPQAPPQPQAQPDVAGIWLDDTGKGAIEIGNCGGNRLCGRIVWLREPVDKSGKPLTDGYNPKAAERQRPICGLQVIGDLKRVGGTTWDEGWIYDPKQGKQFDVEIKPRGPDKLQVTGYLGVKFLSETFVWTRAPGNLVRCDSSQAAQGAAPGLSTPNPQATRTR
jgi:uncharacterized protein (DUF2147 family)